MDRSEDEKIKNFILQSRAEFSKRVLIAASIFIALLALAALLWYTVRVLELIFFAALGAAFLRGIGNRVSKWSKIPQTASIVLVILFFTGLAILAGWLLAPHIQEQIGKMQEELPRAIDEVSGFIRKYSGGMGNTQTAKNQLLGNLGKTAGQIGEVFSITLEVIEDFVIFFFLTLYLTFTPGIYIEGIVKLVPKNRRQVAREIIEALGATLKWWLIGRFSTMGIVGILSGAGLWLLGIPLALTLGILAGLLTFIPYIGAIVSGIPAVLIALLIDFSHAVYVVLLYLGIHAVEGYILAPLIQERTVFVPPMLLLSVLTGMTILLGIPGLIIATPFTALSLVLIKRIYIEGTLGDKDI